jgi:hypothetical protein
MSRRFVGPALAAALTLLAACTGSTSDVARVSAAEPPVVASLPPSPITMDDQGEGSGPAHKDPNGLDPRHVLSLDGAWAAKTTERYQAMYRSPGRAHPSFTFDTRSPVGVESPMLVEDATRVGGKTWLRVLLPIRPNGRAAWLKEKDVSLLHRTDRLVVDLSRRMLWHYRRGTLVGRFRVGVGKPSTPTATGTFYTYERVPMSNPNGPYGIMVFGLSGFSPVLTDWPGGGRMGLHGTPYEWNKGQAVSHGCVRVWNQDMKTLLRLPLGTPVIIQA